MTTATDHKNNLNSSALKKNYARTLRVETIANSAGGTAEVAIVAQPSAGFLNTRFYPNGSPTEDTEDCLGRITVGLTRSKSLTLLVSPLDMMGPMGMAQVIATIAYGIQGLRRGETTWDWPNFNANPEQENLDQMRRWSLNTAPRATRWLSWYGVGLASADRLPVVVRIPAGPLGSLKCDPPKGNGRRPQKKVVKYSAFMVGPPLGNCQQIS